jgi:ATP-dependent Clp protease ATP-binding subunit ClpA
MTRQFSNETKDILNATKNIAKRFGNNYIGVGHFLLCFNNFNQNGRLPICVMFNDKREILKDIKGKKLELKNKRDYVLTKQLEEGLKSSAFHCWIMGDNMIRPEHIYLGLVGSDRANKLQYLDLLKSGNINLNRIKSLVIDYYFTQFYKKIGKHIDLPLKILFMSIFIIALAYVLIILIVLVRS